MLLRTSKQDGSLWPVSHHVTVRPVASKVHPTDNLARDPNDTRKKASTTKNELCSFTRRPRRVSQGWQKNEKHVTFVTYEVFNSSSKTKSKIKVRKFFETRITCKTRASNSGTWVMQLKPKKLNWKANEWGLGKNKKKQFLGDHQHRLNIFARSPNSEKLKAFNSK